jgi:hypothetical protein
MTMTPSPASQSTFNSTPNSFTGMPAPKPATNLMPSLKPMGGQNSAIPGSGAVDFASGPAHSGGTADPDGINHAMQQNIQHVQPQPVGNMNTGMMSPVPGGQMPGQQPPPVPKMAASVQDKVTTQLLDAMLNSEDMEEHQPGSVFSPNRLRMYMTAQKHPWYRGGWFRDPVAGLLIDPMHFKGKSPGYSGTSTIARDGDVVMDFGSSEPGVGRVEGKPIPKMAFIDGFIWQCKKAGLSNQEIIKRATEISLSNSHIALELRPLTKAALQDVGWGSMLGNMGSGLKNMGSNLMHPGEWKNTLMGQGTAGENLYNDVHKYPMKTLAPAVAGGLAGGALAAGTGAAGTIAGDAGAVAGAAGKAESMMPKPIAGLARGVGGYGVGQMASGPVGGAVEGGMNAAGFNPDTSHRWGSAARQITPFAAMGPASAIPGMAVAGAAPTAAGLYSMAMKPDSQEIMTAPHPRSYLSPDQLAQVDGPQGGGAGPGQPPAPPQGQTPVTGENLFGSPGQQPASPQSPPQGQQGPMGDMAGLGPGAAVQQSAGPPPPQGDELSAWDGGPATPGKAPIGPQGAAPQTPGTPPPAGQPAPAAGAPGPGAAEPGVGSLIEPK